MSLPLQVVQSYWTRPGRESEYYAQSGGHQAYGWLERKYHYMSWAYSCLQFTRYHGAVDLYTDEPGKQLLIDQLRLPYGQVSLCMEDLDSYHPDLWVMGKIYAYSQPQVPFLHVDGDVLITAPLPEHICTAPLAAQHVEEGISYYREAWEDFASALRYIPEALSSSMAREGEIKAYNNGLIGGQDLDFFKQYSSEAKKCIDLNIEGLSPKGYDRFNVLFEQGLYYSMASAAGQEVALVMPRDLLPPPQQIAQVRALLQQYNYLHPIYHYKINPYICTMLERWLRRDYPAWYYRILHLLQQGQL